jgi:hypothetical protein
MLGKVFHDETTFARRAWALVGLPEEPAESRRGRETSVVTHGEETVDGVSGGRRLPDLDRAGASVGSE